MNISNSQITHPCKSPSGSKQWNAMVMQSNDSKRIARAYEKAVGTENHEEKVNERNRMRPGND
jgi:hypothetical protein